MWKTILRRLLILIPQLLILSLIVFLLGNAMPGDALTGLMSADMRYEDIAGMREALGLDRPWPVRYVEWIGGIILEGDFGRSFTHARPVMDLIGERAPNTFRLSLVTAIFFYMLAIPLGLLAGRFRETLLDRAIIFYTFFALAMPSVIFALINIFIFGFGLRWFPIQGSVDVRLVGQGAAYWMSRLQHLVLPAFTGAFIGTTAAINVLRSEIINYENSDFVMTARAKGVPRRIVYTRHIFRNACLPIAAGLGFVIAGLLGGSVLIENVFAYPGMGNLFVTSITQRDFAVANVLILMFGALTVLGTLLSDLLMIAVDPRIRIK